MAPWDGIVVSAHDFVAYIDESGDEGFAWKGGGKGSSRWFVLSAVLTRRRTDLSTVKLVDAVRRRLGRGSRQALHFRRLKHEHRVPFIHEISRARLRTVSVLVYKPLLQDPDKFRRRYRLYFYAARLLLERVSWLCTECRDAAEGGDGSARVIFSNRAGMSYDELRAYLRLLRRQAAAGQDVRINWDAIRAEQVEAVNHEKMMGLQIADAVASALFFGVQESQYGFTESRYAAMLRPVVYRRNGDYLSYGLKIIPGAAIDLVRHKDELRWIDDVYAKK